VVFSFNAAPPSFAQPFPIPLPPPPLLTPSPTIKPLSKTERVHYFCPLGSLTRFPPPPNCILLPAISFFFFLIFFRFVFEFMSPGTPPCTFFFRVTMSHPFWVKVFPGGLLSGCDVRHVITPLSPLPVPATPHFSLASPGDRMYTELIFFFDPFVCLCSFHSHLASFLLARFWLFPAPCLNSCLKQPTANFLLQVFSSDSIRFSCSGSLPPRCSLTNSGLFLPPAFHLNRGRANGSGLSSLRPVFLRPSFFPLPPFLF